jgi:hypothetical protein
MHNQHASVASLRRLFAFTGTPFGFPLESPFTFTGIPNDRAGECILGMGGFAFLAGAFVGAAAVTATCDLCGNCLATHQEAAVLPCKFSKNCMALGTAAATPVA